MIIPRKNYRLILSMDYQGMHSRLAMFMSRLIIVTITALMFFSVPLPKAIAYPQDQFSECVLSAKANPVLVGVQEAFIEGFCDCALTAILDEEKNDKTSVSQCAKRTLNR